MMFIFDLPTVQILLCVWIYVCVCVCVCVCLSGWCCLCEKLKFACQDDIGVLMVADLAVNHTLMVV